MTYTKTELQERIVAEFRKLYDATAHSGKDTYEELPSMDDDLNDVLFRVIEDGGYFSDDFVEALYESDAINDLAVEDGIDFEYDDSGQVSSIIIEFDGFTI
jgi:hypothetical protein